jgi:esterase
MELNYKKIGDGFPVFILHGLFGSSDNWQTMGRNISEQGYSVYLIDLRNHGHSPWSDEMNYNAMSHDVFKIVEKEKLNKIILMGHSMGGKAAMTFAGMHPNKIEKLIIVDIGPQRYLPHHDLILKALNAIDTKTIHERKEAELIVSNYIEDVSVRQFLLKNLYWKEKGVLDWRFNLPVIEASMNSILEAVNPPNFYGPTLFIRGANSGYIEEKNFENILEIYTSAEIITIQNAGHWVHAEAPNEFYNVFKKFVTYQIS